MTISAVERYSEKMKIPHERLRLKIEPIQWGFRNVKIKDAGGEIVFAQDNVEAPIAWSDQAVAIASKMYFRRISSTQSESSVRKLIERVVSTITTVVGESVQLSTEQSADYAKELFYLLASQKASFNSPVWFNLGLSQKYKMQSQVANWAVVDGKIKISADGLLHPQVSACFIQSVEDNIESIFDLLKQEAKVFKFGSGSGTNFSKIRARGERLDSGGETSGLMSFLTVFDKSAGTIKSGGTSRRAAKMVCLDIDHPEILDFINWKSQEEIKAGVLHSNGYSGGIDGEALRSVSGQNSNNSVRVTDQFIEAVKNDLTFQTRARTTGGEAPNYRACDLWRAIATAAWNCADPGVQFTDTIEKWNTCANSGPIRASNPCGEFLFLDDSACNLASLNLDRFISDSGVFDFDNFSAAIEILVWAQDALIDLAGYPTQQIAFNSIRLRPIGIGLTNCAAVLMKLGIPYYSDVGRDLLAGITSYLSAQAWKSSIDLARVRGAFSGYKENESSLQHVFEMHLQAAETVSDTEIGQKAFQIWKASEVQLRQWGVRNSQLTLMAPTGTISLIMDCDTTGIEPEYSLLKVKSLSGSGELVQFNQKIRPALIKLNKTETEITELIDLLKNKGSGAFLGALSILERQVFAIAAEISAIGHLKMLAALQPFLSGGISKTINLPVNATIADIEQIYLMAHQWGIKSVAIYRDQSKLAQPLNASSPGEVLSCPECLGKTKKSGNCWVCDHCGFSTACGS